MASPTWIDDALLAEVSREARDNPRRRQNRNFHRMEDPVHRLLNALEPGTYIRPHRHLHPVKSETAIALAGEIGLLVFDDSGRVLASRRLSPGGPDRGADLPGGVWHTLVGLLPSSVFFESKPGPYAPPGPDELAPWAPPEGAPECAAIERGWRGLFPRSVR